MSDAKAPVHLWIVGILALLWNAAGCWNYYVLASGDEAALEGMPAEHVAFAQAYPAWLTAFWALAVWGGLFGAVLLLARKAAAAPVLLLSFVCMLVTCVRNFGFADAVEVLGSGGVAFSVVIFGFGLLLVVYSRAMKANGVLR